MLKKVLLGAVFVVGMLLAGVPAQATEWLAVAANDYGYGWDTAYSEEGARALARANCESETGRSCYSSVSVPSWWDIVVVDCPNGRSVGASKRGVYAAQQIASSKLGWSNCSISYNF